MKEEEEAEEEQEGGGGEEGGKRGRKNKKEGHGELPYPVSDAPCLGTWDAEIRLPSAENQELSNLLFFKPGIGHNIALRAFPECCHEFRLSTLLGSFHFIFPMSLQTRSYVCREY